MKNMYDYINYIKVDKSPTKLEEEFLCDFIKFRKENNMTQEVLSLYSKVSRVKIARIENQIHSPSIKSIIEILGPIGYTIKIEKIKKTN